MALHTNVPFDVVDAPASAGRLMTAMDNLIDLLSLTPSIKAVSTKPALERLRLREYPLLAYVVLYRVDGATVFLEHVFHERQNYEAYV